MGRPKGSKNKPKSAPKCSEGNIASSEPIFIDDKKKHPNWVVTIFKDEEPVFDEDRMKYLLYAPEKCPSTNRHHWQTYVSWKQGNHKTMSATAKWFGATCSLAKGDVEHQLDYIRGPYEKDGKSKPFNPDWKEFGTRPAQGARNDLTALVENVTSGETSVDSIVLENPVMYHQYGRTLHKAEDLAMRKRFRTEMTTCDWLWGPTGVGKSHAAYDGFTPDTHYNWKLNDNGWQDGYTQQPIVIVNEFRGQIKYGELLDMIDKWPSFTAPRRSREPMPFTSKHVIITSSMPPWEVYKNRNDIDRLDQLLRRIKVINMEGAPEGGSKDSLRSCPLLPPPSADTEDNSIWDVEVEF